MPTTTWTGLDNGLTETPANWSAGVPDASTDAVFSGATAMTFDSAFLECLSCDAAGFAGTISAVDPRNNGLSVHTGNVNLSAATILTPMYLEAYGTGGAAGINLGTNAV